MEQGTRSEEREARSEGRFPSRSLPLAPCSSSFALRPSLLAPDLRPVAEKVFAGERLGFDDGLALYATRDLAGLGALAQHERTRRHGRKAFYVLNQHINYSNLCTEVCFFCAFGKRRGQEGGYEMSLEEVFAKAEELDVRHATELHIVGGLHPDLPLDYYVEMLRGLRQRHPKVALKAFTAVEIDWFAQLSGLTTREVLVRLKEAGLDSLPGGGSEVFHEEVRAKVCPQKTSAERWLEIHREAHSLGIRSNATMLYGHVEEARHRVDHLLRLRGLQDETGGFLAFIPLAFHPENAYMEMIPAPGGIDNLRNVAIARLMLDNFEHIKVYWIMLGLAIAQVGLSWGADDLDGTVIEEKIYHMAGATTPEGVSAELLRHLIRQAGFVPVERDALYRERG